MGGTFLAWEQCDDGANNDETDGCSDTCTLLFQGIDCADIHFNHSDWPDGIYVIDPDEAGENVPFQVYCDMTTDGGGWTLIGQGGDQCDHVTNGANTMLEQTIVLQPDACRYLSWPQVSAIAENSEEVELRVGASLDNPSSIARSQDSLAVEALRSSTGTWHNGATWSNWGPWAANCSADMGGWPNMFHACGNVGGPHWYFTENGDQSYRAFCHQAGCTENVSSNWLR